MSQFPGFFGLGKDLGIERVIRIGNHDCHMQFAGRALGDIAGDADWKVRDQIASLIPGFQNVIFETDMKQSRLARQGNEPDGRSQHGGCGRDRRPVDGRIELLEESGMGMGALRHQLEGIFIGESGLLRLAEPGGAERLEAGQILGGERNPGQGRGGEEKAVASFRVKLTRR